MNDSVNANEKNPASRIALIVLLLLILIAFWYALADRFAPSSGRGFIAAHVSQLAPRISGRVVEVYVNDNARIEEGTALYQIDQRLFQLEVDSAQAELEQAAKNVNASSSELAAAQAAVAQARVNYNNVQQSTRRILRVAAEGAVSQADVDNAKARLASARSALDARIADSESAAKRLGLTGESNPQVRLAQVQLEQAQYDLLSTNVVAPEAGVITNLHLHAGQYVNAGQPALTFISSDNYWVDVNLRENQLQYIKVGDPAQVAFDALPGKLFAAKVVSIGWGINPGVQQSAGLMVNQRYNQWFEPARRMPVHVELIDSVEWPKDARVGGKVNVLIQTGASYNPVVLLAKLFHRVNSWLSFFY